jgi:hypothetical protein
MLKHLKKPRRAKVSKVAGRRKRPKLSPEEERILREATLYLIRKQGGLLIATGIREEPAYREARHWILTVTLRYPTGHEGYVGDLLYDGKKFRFITPDNVIAERVRQIDTDPALQREWHAYRATTLPARKA